MVCYLEKNSIKYFNVNVHIASTEQARVESQYTVKPRHIWSDVVYFISASSAT